MSVLTLRTAKGSRLTYDEGDDNFEGLANGTLWNDAALAGKAVTFASLSLIGAATLGGPISSPQVNTNFIDGGAAEVVIRAGDSGVNFGKIKFGQNNSYGFVALADNTGAIAGQLLESADIHLLTFGSRGLRVATDGAYSNLAFEAKNVLGTPIRSWLQASGAPSGVAAMLQAQSLDANASIFYNTKGNGHHIFAGGPDGWNHLEILSTFDSDSNMTIQGAVGNGEPVVIGAVSTGRTGGITDVGVKLAPLGAGDIHLGKALVALGGGSAPTLGTIGGSGPATAGQDSWARFKDSAGAAFWVPAWK